MIVKEFLYQLKEMFFDWWYFSSRDSSKNLITHLQFFFWFQAKDESLALGRTRWSVPLVSPYYQMIRTPRVSSSAFVIHNFIFVSS